MAGYVRQSAASIITGAVILAAPLNAEFNQLQSAFNGTTGHAHTGGAGDGPKLSLTGAMSGVLPIANGGTNASTAAAARITLGLEIGTNVQAYDADLDALAANATNGFWAHTNVGTGAARTLTAPAAGFTITNPAGIAGNPTFVLANDLAALEAMASNGIVTRTASETYALRTITGTAAEVTVSNGDGVAGAPTLSLPAALTFTGKTVTGGTFATMTSTGGTFTTGAFNGTIGATTPSTGIFTTLNSNTGTLSVVTTSAVNNALFTNTDPGATGSIIVQYHNSASPANNDIITYHQRDSNSSTAVTRIMAADFVTVTDTTNTSEDATWTFQNIVAGSLVTQMNMTATGMQIPAIGATTPGTGAFTTLSATGVTTLSGGLVLPQSAAPAQTTEGAIAWDTDDDRITVGTGAGNALFGQVTPWVAYTPTFTGFGTVSGISIWSRRVGDTLCIRGKFTSGISTAVEARMTLGFNSVDGSVTSDATKVASIQIAGHSALSVAGTAAYTILIESSVGYITFGLQNATNAGLSKSTGSNLMSSTNVLSFNAEVPISGWA